jgi:CO/xanthine dehydrogenase FAD-binding subunit
MHRHDEGVKTWPLKAKLDDLKNSVVRHTWHPFVGVRVSTSYAHRYSDEAFVTGYRMPMEFTAAGDLDELLEVKAQQPDAQLLAGGTDLMVEVNLAHHRPAQILSLRRVDALKEVAEKRIGAGVTWARLEQSAHKALAQAARTIGSPQIRAAGTIGGNVGTASPAGDGLPWIAAADAEIVVESRERGERIVPWREFFTGVKRTSLASDEVITGVTVPDDLPDAQEFAKVGTRNAMVIATVSCVVMRADDGFRVALGSVAPTPMRATRAEEMINAESTISDTVLEEFGRIVSDEVQPITDHRSTEAYRRHAAGVLARRLVERTLQ